RREAPGPVPHPGVLAADRRHRLGGDGRRRRHRRAARRALVGTPGPSGRWRPAGLHGAQEEGGIFLMPDTLVPPANDALPLAIRSELRFLTCGSVDDGKSTLIGRLI